MEYDPQLGRQVQTILYAVDLEHNLNDRKDRSIPAESIEHHFRCILRHLKLDLDDPSLKDTPKRVAKMFTEEIFTGLDYDKFPKCTTFPRELDELILVDEIELKSMCEHHWMPIIGKAAVGYVPKGHVMGLSKFNRVVNFFARRPQIQERLTCQISYALQTILETDDVMVIIRADHYCMKMRGVEDFCSNTVTSKVAGRFMTVPPLREEFMRLSRVAK